MYTEKNLIFVKIYTQVFHYFWYQLKFSMQLLIDSIDVQLFFVYLEYGNFAKFT